MTDTSTDIQRQPQQAIVLLEPSDRAVLDVERTELLALLLPEAICSAQEYRAVAADQARVQAFTKKAKPAFDEVCDQAYRTWKSACGLRTLFFQALEDFNARARSLLGAYTQQQERIRREEEARLAEEERQRLLKQQQAEARLLEKQGQKEMAAAVRAQPVIAPAVSLPSAVPPVQGLSFRDVWRWRPAGGDTPQNRAAAVKLVPREYLELNETALNAAATGFRGSVKIAGIEFFVEKVPVRR